MTEENTSKVSPQDAMTALQDMQEMIDQQNLRYDILLYGVSELLDIKEEDKEHLTVLDLIIMLATKLEKPVPEKIEIAYDLYKQTEEKKEE